jgi:hypothetical protein
MQVHCTSSLVTNGVHYRSTDGDCLAHAMGKGLSICILLGIIFNICTADHNIQLFSLALPCPHIMLAACLLFLYFKFCNHRCTD